MLLILFMVRLRCLTFSRRSQHVALRKEVATAIVINVISKEDVDVLPGIRRPSRNCYMTSLLNMMNSFSVSSGLKSTMQKSLP